MAYAHAKGIEVGGYDLICLDRGYNGYGGNVGNQWDVVETNGEVGVLIVFSRSLASQLGADACFASGWVDKLTDYVFNFINVTGLSMLEVCVAVQITHFETGFADGRPVRRR